MTKRRLNDFCPIWALDESSEAKGSECSVALAEDPRSEALPGFTFTDIVDLKALVLRYLIHISLALLYNLRSDAWEACQAWILLSFMDLGAWVLRYLINISVGLLETYVLRLRRIVGLDCPYVRTPNKYFGGCTRTPTFWGFGCLPGMIFIDFNRVGGLGA